MFSSGWARFAHKFTNYYKTSSFWTPPRMKFREWMFIPFGNVPPIRHKGFHDMNQVRDFITSKPMHSCFYSTAYWEKPYELKMADKQWLGADLIFDLDGDHLPGVTDRDFPSMISVIQEQAYSLWNDYLQPEFGFDEKFLQVTFSGHRGFHLHYRDPSLFQLDSEARREMVSYIRGEGVDVKGSIVRFNNGDLTGWAGRMSAGMEAVTEKLRKIGNKESNYTVLLKQFHEGLKSQAKREGRNTSKGLKSIQNLGELLVDDRRKERLLNGNFGVLDKHETLFLDLLKTDSAVIMATAGEADEVVTIDVRRQIRWPTSLHGKSGMRVSEFPLTRLDPDKSNSYDPLSEAVVLGRGNNIKLEIVKDDCHFRFFDQSWECSTGDIIDVHESASTFLVVKGWAKIV